MIEKRAAVVAFDRADLFRDVGVAGGSALQVVRKAAETQDRGEHEDGDERNTLHEAPHTRTGAAPASRRNRAGLRTGGTRV